MKKKLFSLALVLAILIAASMLCLNKKMEEQKDPYNVSAVLDDKGVKLYKRGFRLLEEQLATYIKEHYSGVSKIEFSPIFVQGGDGQTMFDANIVPVIYDNHVRALILLDGGYLDMEKILPLEEELEGTASFMKQQVFATLEEAVLSELGDQADPTPIARKAVEASYRWNPVSEQYELNLDLEKVMALLRLRRQIKTYQIPLADLPVLFIGPRYQEEPEWRKDALKQLDPQIKQVLLEGLGHELYTEAPEIVAREVNNWLQNVHK